MSVIIPIEKYTIVKYKSTGFTIVELLIVIVVIGILAAITTVAYNGVQERAKNVKSEADLRQLQNTIIVARTSSDKTLYQIVRDAGYSGNFVSSKCTLTSSPNTQGKNLSFLPKSNDCWKDYKLALNAIAKAGNTNLTNLENGDPNGQPYFIDQNEGESATKLCAKDIIGTYTDPLPNSWSPIYGWVDKRIDLNVMTAGC